MKHEYLGGVVSAMAGASEAHHFIAINLTSSLHPQLRGKPCQVFGSEMKVRMPELGIELPLAELFERVKFPG